MAEIEGRPGLDDLVLREADPNSKYGQFWVTAASGDDDGGEPRAMYTDDEGKDYDIVDMRDALLAIQANTKPTAVSLSLRNRVRAIYAICCQALPDG